MENTNIVINKQQQIEIATKMRNEGKKNDTIAAHFNKLGVRTLRGKPSAGYVHYILNPKIYAKRKKTVAVSTSNTTKWDVMRTIESCEEFKPQIRKALIGLILQELYK